MTTTETNIWIAGACRTPIGSFLGTLSAVSPVRLAALVFQEALRRAGVRPEQVNEVILGGVLTASLGQNIARQASVMAGIPVEVTAETLNMVCGSGMRSIIRGAQAILCGDAEVVLAGGVESMSGAVHALPSLRRGWRMGTSELLDTMITDGLTDAFSRVHMGVTAENVASRFGLSRGQLDEFACASQNRAEAAIRAGRFQREIATVAVPQKDGSSLEFAQDEHPRFGTTMQALAKLKPAFQANGVVTAGNSSGINDGAAAVVLLSERAAQETGVSPIARIRGYGVGGVPPEVMGLGPIPATRQALGRAGIGVPDLDLIEANEAFAAQCLAVRSELNLPEDRTNVNGGAIALGHPIGASGTRILVTLLHEMQRRDARLGLATLCIGGGMGAAVIVER